VTVALFAADVGLVYLDGAVDVGQASLFEDAADAMRQVPRRLLGDPQIGGQLDRRLALGVGHDQEQPEQLGLGWELRVVHWGCSSRN